MTVGLKHNTTTQYSASKIVIYNNQTLIASICKSSIHVLRVRYTGLIMI